MGLFVYETGSEKVSRLFRWINRLMKFEKFEQKGSRVIAQYHLHPLFHGVRTLTLTPKQDGTTHFNLKEELKGWFVILVKSSIEMAKENMEHYAMKLKTETEHRSKELVSSEH